MKPQSLKLVQVHGKKLTTTSLIISDLFNRPHKNVLRSLDKLSNEISGLVFEPSEYIDKNGEARRMLILDERQFLIAMPFIGGTKSMTGQIKLVDEFLRLQKILNDPSRKAAIQYKRDTAKTMTDMLVFVRETQSKATAPKHYSNEHLFCNRALTGSYKALDESELDEYDAKLLGAIRIRNSMLMTRNLPQPERKVAMDTFVAEYRQKNPRLTLVG